MMLLQRFVPSDKIEILSGMIEGGVRVGRHEAKVACLC